MRDHISSPLGSLTAKIGNLPVRLVALDEPEAEVRVAFDDVFAVAGFPQATRPQTLKAVSAAELSTIVLQGRQTPVVKLSTARELMMRAAELGHCPAYQTDIFEVIASYARDQLSYSDPCASGKCESVVDEEGGE